MSRAPSLRRAARPAAASTAVLGLVCAALAASPASAASVDYSQLSLSATVTGTSVVAETKVKASAAKSVSYYGVCARSSSDANVDFDKSAASITTTGTVYRSQPKTFAPGTYSYFPCVYDGTWHNVGAAKQFTVGAPAATTKVSIGTVTDDSVTVKWTPVSGATGYKVARDGTDTGGSGPWSTTDPSGATSRTFLHLVKGTKYTFTVTPQPNGAPQSVTATPGSQSAPASPVQASASVSGENATLTWNSSVSPSAGWTVSRDGTDTGGTGPWSTTVSGSTRSFVFQHLVAGRTYNLTVASSAGKATVAVKVGSSTTPTPTKPPTPTPGDTSPGWLSGGAADGNDIGDGSFGAWRGSPVEIGQSWPNSPDVWSIQPGAEYGSWNGPLSLSLDPGSNWKGWASLARGDQDAFWHAMGKNLQKYRAGKGTTYLSPFYEFNGDWMTYSVRPGDEASFRAGFARVSSILRSEFPSGKILLPAACSRGVPSAMIPASSSYDMGACTIYNVWPFETSGASAMQKLEVGRARAAAAGKPFAITEWSNGANPRAASGGGEAPAFIDAMHDYLVRHAGSGSGQIVFETVFNIGGYESDHQLWSQAGGVSRTMPRTAEEYRLKF